MLSTQSAEVWHTDTPDRAESANTNNKTNNKMGEPCADGRQP